GNSQSLWNSITEVELYTGSSVTVSSERLRIDYAKVSNGQKIVLQWPALTNAVSQVQSGTRAGNWSNVGPLITNAGGLQTWQETVASSTPVKFYRISQTPITTPPPPPTTNLPTIGKVYAAVQMGSKKMACYLNRPVDQYDPRVTRAI